MADIGAFGTDLLPVTAFQHLEAMVLRELRKLRIPFGLFQGGSEFFVVDIGDSLEEQQGEDIGFEISRIDWPT
ncbi:hypothetical protein NOC27_3175 [Nitrosococcus oceani AFC27]|uniref:Uncharacterized protein n=1 Tax=Nitrosococcus oceani C-27 TaxID=314279 RepID=A0A0E2YY17_9GAMM|nr:hypothetical protein [Nitrosococcus oceani]EDZ66495.1 hypothetical protein NOC27_3175 [Nitrosococcus oceani AFC27]KFI18104.1 hypothetical protein IB75_15520 [Nitrosococcus oceani C-27]GEM20060.1 hypothetical protein NONS58_14650 [Nitrosococcus oceani]